MTSDDLKYVSIQHVLNWSQTCLAEIFLSHLSTWKRIASFTKCKTSLFSSSGLISIYKMFINILKLNSESEFLIEKLNRSENFSCIWQWWQYLFRCSMTRDSTLSWSDRVRISYRRRAEKWSNRRCRRRNSISINRHEFSSMNSTISEYVEIFQRRNAWPYRRITEWRRIFELIWKFLVIWWGIFWIISLIRLLKYSFKRFRSFRQSKNGMLISTMWKVIISNEIFRSTNSKINVLSISNLMLDSTVFWSITTSLIRCRALNCSMSPIDRSAASQFTSMSLNSRSSYLESVIEIKLKSSLMKILMMMQFFEIKRCLNVRFASKLVVVSNSMFCNSSTVIKNSSIDSNSIKSALVKFVDKIAEMIAEVLAEELIENSSKYWIISSWSSISSSSVLSYSQIYWWRRLLFLNWEKRSAKRFFEFFRYLSEWLIDQQSNLSQTKHFLDRRLDWNLSFDLSRNSSR